MKRSKTLATISRKKALAAAIPLIMAAQAQGFEFYAGDIEGSFDSEISMGSSWRMEEQDSKLFTNGNSDDGNANFADGSAFSQVFKGSHDLQVSYENFGGFVRGKYWYDSALKDNNVDYGHSPTATLGTSALDPFSVNQAGNSRLDDAGFNDSGAELLDAYVYGEFTVADMPLDVRLGKQVLSWGESTFIFGGINAINPVDVNAFTRPGAEIKEGLLPVNMAYASIGLTDNLSAEAFYQLDFQETVLPGCGTYFYPVVALTSPPPTSPPRAVILYPCPLAPPIFNEIQTRFANPIQMANLVYPCVLYPRTWAIPNLGCIT